MIRNDLRWRNACKNYGLHKTFCNSNNRWSRLDLLKRILPAPAAKGGKPDQLIIDATRLKAHRTAGSVLKKVLFPEVSVGPKVA